METYKIPTTFSCHKTFEIEAESLEEAVRLVKEENLPFSYITGTFVIDMEGILVVE